MPLYCRTVFLTALVAVLVGLFSLPGALVAAEATNAAGEKRLRVGISMPSFRESRWQADLQALQTQADLQRVDILVRFAGNDPKQQNIQMKELVNIGIDALIVSATDVFDAMEGIDFAQSRKVPVISYDRLAEDCTVDAFVAFEREGVGEIMGSFLAERAPKGNYILLRGPQSDSNAQAFYNGAMKHLSPLIASGSIKVLLEAEVPGWRADAAERLAAGVLKKNKNIAGILAPNDDTAGGVLEALARHGLAGKVPITGQDASPAGLERVYKGLQSMTILKNSNLLARQAMHVAVGLARREPVPTSLTTNNGKGDVPTYKLPVTFVDKGGMNWILRLVEFY